MTVPDAVAEVDLLLQKAAAGDRESWGVLLNRHRDRLIRMVSLRLDQRLRGRLDASDVVQDACLEASQRLHEYLDRPDIPFFLWLRFLTGQRISILHRHHFGAQMRNAAREVPMEVGGAPATTSAGLAACLIGREPRPSEAAVRSELLQQYEAALDKLDAIDREVLALRHYEQLTNAEVAHTLGLQESAASKRYIRAVQRLRDALAATSGGAPETEP